MPWKTKEEKEKRATNGFIQGFFVLVVIVAIKEIPFKEIPATVYYVVLAFLGALAVFCLVVYGIKRAWQKPKVKKFFKWAGIIVAVIAALAIITLLEVWRPVLVIIGLVCLYSVVHDLISSAVADGIRKGRE